MEALTNIKQHLMARYPYKFELHCHSAPASGCSELPPTELVQRCKDAGAHGLVLTNHAVWWMKETEKEKWCAQYLKDYLDTKEAGEHLGLTVLFGMEIRFMDTENDYLLFGFDEHFIPVAYEWMDKNIRDFYNNFHSENVLVLQAHPHRKNMVEMDRSCVDGYEVFNMHPGHNSAIAFSSRLHHQCGGIITGGTDLHHRGHEGSMFTCFAEMPQNEADLVRLLRNGDYVFMTADKIIIP